MRSFVNIPYLVRSRIASVKVKASDDEDMVPILSGRRKSGFTPREYEQLRNPTLLGGKTIGEELAILKERHDAAEQRAMETSDQHFVSENWDGDVYIGSRWNTLSVIYMIFMLSIFGSMLFAWLSYGHLWGVTPGLY
jgi:hypothetical protein